MKGLLVVAAIVGCCVARPDIGLKLREQANKFPSTNYGYPSGQYLPPVDLGNSGTHQEHHYQNKETPSHNEFIGVQHGTFQTQGGGDISYHSTIHGSTFHNSATSFKHSSHSSHSSQGSTVDNKYFFNAPEDILAPLIKLHQQVDNGKNHQLVFIKAPTYQTPKIEVPSYLEQNAEKTKIYVLVKKPEVQHIEIPSVASKTPTKPEVFFIKYKTQKEAEDKIHRIQNGGSVDEIKSTDLGSEASLLKTIHDETSTGKVFKGTGHVSKTGFENTHSTGHHESGTDQGYQYSNPRI